MEKYFTKRKKDAYCLGKSRSRKIKNDTERLEYLFKQYEEMLQKDTLFAKQKKKRLNR